MHIGTCFLVQMRKNGCLQILNVVFVYKRMTFFWAFCLSLGWREVTSDIC